MKPLEPLDSLHLQAAEGWVGLGDYASASNELEQISPTNHAHPDVLQLRWRIYANAKNWEACLDIATALTAKSPEHRLGWLHLADALNKLNRTGQAKEVLLAALERFGKSATIPYHLAQCCAKLGQVAEGKAWLGKALLMADSIPELGLMRDLALQDPDLEPLRKEP